MKYAAQLLMLVLAFALGGASATAAQWKTSSIQSSSRDYVRLNDWARVNQLSVRWISPGKTVELNNSQARFVFTVDPRQDCTKAVFNGVEVSLAFPMRYQNGAAYISQTDLSQTLKPVLSPPRTSPGDKIKTICIDPGHGGKDPGYMVGRNQEKKYTLLLAQEVRDQLKTAGFNVIMTRSTDYYLSLEDRPALARKRNADLFVSLHFNAFPGSSAIKGLETYCLTPAGAYSSHSGGEGNTRWVSGNRNNEENMQLAYQLHRSLVKTLPVEDRGIKRARWKVLTEASMPAVLIEGGFMSNPTEGKRIFDPTYRRQMAKAIVNGILAYQKAVKG
jgi:N-acetylmuramoyl-L-alanine amidase